MKRYRFTGDLPPGRFNLARYCLRGAAQTAAEATALVVVSAADLRPEAFERWSFGEIDITVRRVAAELARLGLAPGDRIMIRMENTAAFALLFFGAIAAGCVALPTSSQLTAAEAEFLAADAGARLVVTSSDLAIGAPGNPRTQVLGDQDLRSLRGEGSVGDYADTAADEPAFLIYTSGTTGRAKGVLHAHRAAWGRRPMYQGWYGGLSRRDTMLHAGAFNWTYTLGVGLMDPWANGAAAIIYNGPRDVSVWPRLVDAFGATLMATVPSLYRQILRHCDLEAYDLSSLRHCLTAGEALSPNLAQDWRARCGLELYEALGMSECSTYVSSAPDVPPKPGSPGKPQQGRCVVALPTHGGDTPLPAGEVGLLAVHRSDPGLMLGYWNRPEEERLVYRGEWFVGGDLVSFDSDGYVRYHGRHDDLMNAMGYRVSPLEVEECLHAHPQVAEVAVTELAVRDDVRVVAAFVVPEDAEDADAEPLLEWAKERLAAYKRPREIIFVDSLPKTANGKLLRRELAGLAIVRNPG